MLGHGGQAEAMATIFVWLRYSSSRQLTWQRNYNTQPRILGEAQARLTHAIAQVRRRMACAWREGMLGIHRMFTVYHCFRQDTQRHRMSNSWGCSLRVVDPEGQNSL